jgi:hypothetical protein
MKQTEKKAVVLVITVNGTETELPLMYSPLAVEKIEDEFDMSIEEVFSKPKMKAKDVSFMLFALANPTGMRLGEFKEELSKKYTYSECMKLLTDSLTIPNVEDLATEEKTTAR